MELVNTDADRRVAWLLRVISKCFTNSSSVLLFSPHPPSFIFLKILGWTATHLLDLDVIGPNLVHGSWVANWLKLSCKITLF